MRQVPVQGGSGLHHRCGFGLGARVVPRIQPSHSGYDRHCRDKPRRNHPPHTLCHAPRCADCHFLPAWIAADRRRPAAGAFEKGVLHRNHRQLCIPYRAQFGHIFPCLHRKPFLRWLICFSHGVVGRHLGGMRSLPSETYVAVIEGSGS